MTEKIATKPGYVVKDLDNHQAETVKLELRLHISKKNIRDGLSFTHLTALASDAIIDCVLFEYPHLITEDPLSFYRARSNNDYLGHLAESSEWRKKASRKLIELGDQYNKEHD